MRREPFVYGQVLRVIMSSKYMVYVLHKVRTENEILALVANKMLKPQHFRASEIIFGHIYNFAWITEITQKHNISLLNHYFRRKTFTHPHW